MLGVVVFGRSKFSLSAKIAEFATSAKQIALGSSVLCNSSLEFTVIHEVFFLIIIASLPNYYLSLIAILIFEIISDI
jgi:hypothetical protein